MNFLSITSGWVLATAEWVKSFVSKYAGWILAIVFTMIFVRGFGAKISR